MNKIDKKSILQQLIMLATDEWQKLKNSASTTAEGAKSSEAKQEGKYDTRALLDSYLAGAQNARVKSLESEISVVKALKFRDTAYEKIEAGCIVKLIDLASDSPIYYFILPCLAGFSLKHQGISIQTISLHSPLGKLLIGQFLEEHISLKEKQWEILEIH